MSKTFFWLRSILVVSVGSLFYGCGDAQNGAPAGSTISFNPSGYTYTNYDPAADCYFDAEPFPVQIILKDAAGNYLNDVAITVAVDADFALLYDDADGDMVFDSTEANPVTSTYLTKTGAFGSKRVFMHVLAGGTACTGTTSGLAYTTDLAVFTGGSYNKLTVTVTSK